MNRLRVLLAGFALLACCIGAGAVEAPTGIVIEEAASGTGTSTISAKLAPIVATDASTGAAGDLPLPDATIVRATAFTAAASYGSEAEAITAVRTAIEPGLAAVEASIRTLLASTGQQLAQYQYRVSVTVDDGVNPRDLRTVTLSEVVRADGTVERLGTKISAGAMRVLMVSYEQLQVAPGFPAGWARPNAGKIVWQLYSESGGTLTPIGTQTVEDAAGAYDEPQDFTDTEVDPQTGVALLASNWVVPKLAAEKASKAIVDYGRTVEPVYDEDADGNSVARVAIDLPTRVFTAPSACDPSAQPHFQVKGEIGWALNNVVERYLLISPALVPGADLIPVGQIATRSVSPTAAVDKSVYLAAGTSSADFGDRVINPWNSPAGQENTVYSIANDTVHQLPADRYLLQGLIVRQQDSTDINRWCGDVPGVGRVIADTASGALSVNGNAVGFRTWTYRVSLGLGIGNRDAVTTTTTTTMPGVARAGGSVGASLVGASAGCILLSRSSTWSGIARFDAGADAHWRYVGAGFAFAFAAQLSGSTATASPSADYMVLPPGSVVASASYGIQNCQVNTAVTGWQTAARARLYRVMPSGNSITYTPVN